VDAVVQGGVANMEERRRSNTFNDELDMEASMSQTQKVAPPKEKRSNILASYVDTLGKCIKQKSIL
jgi:hypothetical protein